MARWLSFDLGPWIARLLVAAGLAGIVEAAEARWPQFRGPNADGVGGDGTFPTEFGPATNLWWKLPLPAGQSSPCIWDDALFVTAYAEPELVTLCIAARSGGILWQRSIAAEAVGRGSGLGSPAAPTPCTDGERVFSYFGPFGVVCYDFAGAELWRCPLPEPATQHGVGSSPVLAGDRVILLRDQDVDSHLLALAKETGEILWRAERPQFRRGFSTPLVIGPGEKSIIVAAGTLTVAAYGVRNGQELWRVSGLPNEICSSPVSGHGLVFCAGWTPGSGVPRMPDFDPLLAQGDKDGDGKLARGEVPNGPARQHFNYMDADRDGSLSRAEYDFIANVFNQSRNALLAVRPDGSGDVTASHVAWRHGRGLPYVPTPLLYRDRIYLVKNGGLVSCLNATNGAVMFQEERIGVLGDNYASPVAGDGRIVIASQSGTIAVLAAGDELKVLARNPLSEPLHATPAIAHDALYVRSQKHLWAFRDSHRD